MSIFIVRHGQSIGNLDLKNYQTLADHSFELTDLGREQARTAAHDIVKACDPTPGDYHWIPREGHMVWISPYKRTRETAAAMIEVFNKEHLYLHEQIESPLIVEKQYGLYNSIAGEDDGAFQEKFPLYDDEYKRCHESDGRFFARPPGGESDFDVFIRAEIFWQKLLTADPGLKYNHTIVCHGTTMRILTMVILNKEYEWFQRFDLPGNGVVINPSRGFLNDGSYTPFHE